MKRIAATVALLLAMTCVAAANAAATKDPRKCVNKFGYVQTAVTCANTAAVNAIEAKFAAMPTKPDPQPACDPAKAPYLIVRCAVSDSLGGNWKAVVRFRGTPSGWRTVVTLTKIP